MGGEQEIYLYESRRATRKRSLGGHLLDMIMFVVTLILALLLICSYLACRVNPNDVWIFSFAGLIAPVLYVLNIAMILYWVIRWRYWVFIPLAVVLLGAGKLSLFFRPTISRHYAEAPLFDPLKMISYNVHGFYATDESGKTYSTRDSVMAFVAAEQPDLVCFQEFECSSSDAKYRIDSLLGGELPYNVYNFKKPNSRGGGWGVAIYSRFPVLKWGVVDFPESSNSSIWADLLFYEDTLRVFNNHMQTTKVSSSDREYIDRQEFLQNDVEHNKRRVRSIVSKLRENYKIRAEQADSLAPMLAASPYEVIVCGDFNDTPMSYTYRKMRGDLRDAFVEKGHGRPSTFRGLFNLFRIDYVLHSDRLKTVSYVTLPYEYSDHKPVIVNFDLQE